MTPKQKIKVTIIYLAIDNGEFSLIEDEPLNENSVDDYYDSLKSGGIAQDYAYEFREGEEETNIPCEYSRHYETKSVASKMFDGSWVGWTCYYGGGKHGEPEAFDWMSEAYFLDCKEEQKLVTVYTFNKV